MGALLDDDDDDDDDDIIAWGWHLAFKSSPEQSVSSPLVGRQEWHQACKKLGVGLLVVTI